MMFNSYNISFKFVFGNNILDNFFLIYNKVYYFFIINIF